MELLILGGLVVLFVLAAAAGRGEREVETVVIALPAARPTANPLVPVMVAVFIILLVVIGLDRLSALLGM